MTQYSIESLLSVYNDINSEAIHLDNYLSWINSYVEISKPDFIVVLNVQELSPVIYQKNYNLKFSSDKKEHFQEIFDNVDECQLQKIIEADTLASEFAFNNFIEPVKCTYYMRFNSCIDNVSTRSFLRNVTLLSRDKNNLPQLVLTTISDITHINGSQEIAQVDIKNYVDGKNCLGEELSKLKERLVSIFKSDVVFTKREKQILKLISEGMTSMQIANELNISTATVNTHRQNLIKKNNVSSTSALINGI